MMLPSVEMTGLLRISCSINSVPRCVLSTTEIDMQGKSCMLYGKELTTTPKYLGVTPDRTLSFKQHCLNTKAKVSLQSNIIRKLINYTWGAQPSTLCTSALALRVSVAEYAAQV